MTKLGTALSTLDRVRDEISKDLLKPATAPDVDAVAEKKRAADAAGADANEAWRKRAFDYSTSLAVALTAGAVLLPGFDRDKATNCPDRKASCGYDISWDGYGALGSSLAWAAIATFVGLLFISLFGQGRDRGGLVGLIVGTDNRLSTSKFQVLLWTVAVVFSFFFFVFQLAFGQDTAHFESLNGEYLLLLGGPFAAAVLAKQAASTRVGEAEQQVPAAKPGVGDLVQDGSENGAVADAQFLLFNLVALAYFVTALVRSPTALPDLPDTLVGLTSVSALTYLGAKVVGNNLPVIESVSLVTGTSADGKMRADSQLRILGRNFIPEEARAGNADRRLVRRPRGVAECRQ